MGEELLRTAQHRGGPWDGAVLRCDGQLPSDILYPVNGDNAVYGHKYTLRGTTATGYWYDYAGVRKQEAEAEERKREAAGEKLREMLGAAPRAEEPPPGEWEIQGVGGVFTITNRVRRFKTVSLQDAEWLLDRLRASSADAPPAAGPEPSEARVLVKQQADDEGLWFDATTAVEAYLQQALRALHAAVERGAAAQRQEGA